jgi:hypothetical protein
MRQRSASPWKLVRLGCAALVLAAAVTVAAFLFVGHRMAQAVREQMDDPALRLADARRILRAETLPDGYGATLAITVPLFGRVVVLEGPQRPLGDNGELGPSRLFLYLEGRRSAPPDGRAEELDRLLEVRGLELESGPPLSQGKIETLDFRTIRARLRQRPHGEWPVLAALLDIRCPSDEETVRFGVWVEPDPAPGWEAEEIDLTGTPADPAAIRDFMSAFRLCDG